MPPKTWLEQQFDYDAVEHLIKSGRLLKLHYDIETTDLNPMFAALTQFSGVIVDLTGKIIDEIDLKVQVPEDVVPSPQACIVTETMPEDMYQREGRDPPHIAAAKISQFFLQPYRRLWDTLAAQSETIISGAGKEEEVRVYKIRSQDGQKEAVFRLHQGGKFISYPYQDDRLPDGGRTYRDPDGSRWKRIAAPADTEGYNNKRYDDRVLWSFLHRAVAEKIFVTHIKKYQRFRVDTLDVAKLVSLLDTGGEEGFKAADVINTKNGEPYKSYKLSKVINANTREANPERGISGGVQMPEDGSNYDERRAHTKARYDVLAEIALKHYLRKRAPDVVRVIEQNAEFERLKPFLMGDRDFAMKPVRAFARHVFPHEPQLNFGVCVNINEQIEERRQAVMIRTDMDVPLESYTYRGKKLLDMSVDEIAFMMQKQRGRPDALMEVINLRKNPPVVPAEMAYARGLGGDPERHESNRRFVLSNEGLVERIMEAHTKSMAPMPGFESIRNPQSEEHLFTGLAEPKRYEFEMDGKPVMVSEAVHADWVKVLRRNRSLDRTLRRVIEPDAIEFEARQDTLDDFVKKIAVTEKHLEKYLGSSNAKSANGAATAPLLPTPEANYIPTKWDYQKDPDDPAKKIRVPHVMSTEECERLTANAVEYLWKLRAELMYEFNDNTTRYRVEDAQGHEIPFETLNKMKEADLADRLRTGKYTVACEQLNWTAELTARMFRDAGRIDWVKDQMRAQGRDAEVKTWENWETYFDALKALRINGAPHEDTDEHRWMTAEHALKEITRIKDNMKMGVDIRADEEEWGLYDVFLRAGDKAEAILDQCERHARSLLADSPLTPERMALMGYDAERGGLPVEFVKYEVPAGAKIIELEVPDRMLDQPLTHHHVAPKLLMLDPPPAMRQALLKGEGDYLVLRGAESGRRFIVAKPALLNAKQISPTPYFQDVYDAARNALSRQRRTGAAGPRQAGAGGL